MRTIQGDTLYIDEVREGQRVQHVYSKRVKLVGIIKGSWVKLTDVFTKEVSYTSTYGVKKEYYVVAVFNHE